MADVVPYGKRYWYDHMGAGDAAIWHRFVQMFPDQYDNVQYDVGVGPVPDFVLADPELMARGQAPLYKLKIDVVAFKGEEIDLIEVKVRAGPSSLGQINAYRHLYIKEFSPPETPKAIIVTDELRPGMDELAAAAGVLIVVV